MPTVWITGANGFAGRHLVDHLAASGDYRLHGTCYNDPADTPAALRDKLDSLTQVDVRDPAAVQTALESVQPDIIVHLAAQTHTPDALRDPWPTLETNMRGTLNILEGLRTLHLNATRLVNISSSNVYGIVPAQDLPLREDQSLNPSDPYGLSKVGQDWLGQQYHHAYDLAVITARPFNHTGPGQDTRFVLPNFAMQIARIERDLAPPVLKVGNLSAERDFLDVRDVVRAYTLLALHGAPGGVYHVCRGESHPLDDLVQRLIGLSTVDIQVEVDEARLRPVDLPRLLGGNSALRQATGWQPSISVDDMLAAVLDDCRQRLASAAE